MPAVSVVLPAYNEELRLGASLDALFAYLRSAARGAPGTGSSGAALPPDVEVLVVDDGSEDGTAALVEARPERHAGPGEPRLELLVVPHRGKGAAIRAGMLASRGDLVIFADADLATPPDQLPAMVKALAEFDVVLGSRIQPDGADMRQTQPRRRQWLGRLVHALIAVWAVGDVDDTQCGFKGFTRAAADDLFARSVVNGFAFDIELICLARKRGYRIGNLPIRWQDRPGSTVHFGARLAFGLIWDIFRIPLLHRDTPAAQAQPVDEPAQ